jgi:alpha-tubulin suppressor-like RCC1 family protein
VGNAYSTDDYSLADVQAVAAGAGYTCALTDTGGVRCWGFNALGQLGDGTTISTSTPPISDTLTGVKAIAAGTSHTCALMETGSVRCWGDNTYGQLGDGTTINHSTPTNDVLTDAIAIAAGSEYTCAITHTGSVRCWGRNYSGQVGDGSDPSSSVLPTDEVLTGVKAIAAGYRHTCALMETGGVRCWGEDEHGQLGDGNTTTWRAPATETNDVLTNVKAIAAGALHTCALTETGGVRCWGSNSEGELGNDNVYRNAPPESDALTGVKAIAAGENYTCALMETSGVRCWGGNDYGQLGSGTTISTSIPPTNDVLTGVKSLATGGAHTCALMETGGIRCWGFNALGQLGESLSPDTCTTGESYAACRMTPQPIDAFSGAAAVAAGMDHTCALTETGGVRCWGFNALGQLGESLSPNTCTIGGYYFACRMTPQPIDAFTGAAAITAGMGHTCVLTETGGVRCWGWWPMLGSPNLKDYGACSSDLFSQSDELRNCSGCSLNLCSVNPPTADVLTGVKAISAGEYHTCALMNTGGVRCWGSNDYGQLGKVTSVVLTPARVLGTRE